MRYTPTREQKAQFIAEIMPLAVKAYATLGKVHPSICIAMACVESGFGYGTDGSRLMYKHNAVLGQKVGSGKTATKYWSGAAFTAKTKEEYTPGVHTTLPAAAFRAYDSLEQCIFNYYELLNTSLYKGVKAGVDHVTQMTQIKACGYMTSSTEVNSVLTIIREYGLEIYDDDSSKIDPVEEYPVLRKGDRGNHVEAWQRYLNMHGYNCGAVDGIFGKKTLEAVCAYQIDEGLVPDGIIGALTWATVK